MDEVEIVTAADPRTVTGLLLKWRQGDEDALNRLIPLVYADLRRTARNLMRSERKDHTLEATAVVHEAYARLVDAKVSIKDRAHFLGIAATAMRQILVDHARAHNRAKRGGGATRVTLGDAGQSIDSSVEMLQLDQSLERLGERDPRKRRAAELHLFAGMTYPEVAEVLEVSVPTVQRDMHMALAWIRSDMSSGGMQ